MQFDFNAIEEALPGSKWQATFEQNWEAYQAWFLSEGDEARPTYRASMRKLQEHMPELLPTYEAITELAGGSDSAARCLALYRPPPYLSGCSQAIWTGEEPFLVRNYDYSPKLCEGTLLCSTWNGRKVMAMVDCLWGAVDGMNDSGLVISLTFGGRRVVGDGFGVPLIMRYILEFCDNTKEAVSVLSRIPIHMAYNVSVVDRQGIFRTVYLSPDRAPIVRQIPFATNHQGGIEWHAYAKASATVEREQYLAMRLANQEEKPDELIASFLHSPLYSTGYQEGFGTIYSAVYYPLRGVVELKWPYVTWIHSFDDFREGLVTVTYEGGRPAYTNPY